MIYSNFFLSYHRINLLSGNDQSIDFPVSYKISPKLRKGKQTHCKVSHKQRQGDRLELDQTDRINNNNRQQGQTVVSNVILSALGDTVLIHSMVIVKRTNYIYNYNYNYNYYYNYSYSQSYKLTRTKQRSKISRQTSSVLPLLQIQNTGQSISQSSS